MSAEFNIDALIPAEMARRAEIIGVRKSQMAGVTMFSLAVLAGAFIGLGANFATVVSTGAAALPYGVGRLLAGVVFCLGLILAACVPLVAATLRRAVRRGNGGHGNGCGHRR